MKRPLDVRVLVERTRQASGVPAKVTDPVALARVAIILKQAA